MPGTRRAYLNDNIRTEHLKCSGCRTQVYLLRIEPDEVGGETRIFCCPHCQGLRAMHVEPLRPRASEPALAVSVER